MDAKLIAAAAKLCGWAREEWDGEDNEQCWAAVWPIKYGHRTDSPPFLTDAGLLAVEAELRRRGWSFPALKGGPFCCESETSVVCNSDRATAACMAAQVEVGDES